MPYVFHLCILHIIVTINCEGCLVIIKENSKLKYYYFVFILNILTYQLFIHVSFVKKIGMCTCHKNY